MTPTSVRHFWKSLVQCFRSKRSPSTVPVRLKKFLRYVPYFERLEDRITPVVDTFTNRLGGLWSQAGNGSLSAAPVAGQDAVVSIASSDAVTHASGTDTVNNLTSDGSLDVTVNGGSQFQTYL